MSRGKLRYKLILEILLGILRLELTDEKYQALIQLLASAYKRAIKEEVL